MATYRKKPILVEAEQWFPGKKTKGVQRIPESTVVVGDKENTVGGGYFVETMHNSQRVFLEPGDYIIPEPDGIHFYPVKPSVFEANHEKIAE